MENKVFKSRKKIGEFKTFGEFIREGRDKKGYSRLTLEDILSSKKNAIPERQIKLWEKDAAYPDITTIYMLAEILEISPNELLEAKQNMQEAGLNAIDMLTMRVICNFIDISIWKLHIINNILFWIFLIATCGVAWGVDVPILGPIIGRFLSLFHIIGKFSELPII